MTANIYVLTDPGLFYIFWYVYCEMMIALDAGQSLEELYNLQKKISVNRIMSDVMWDHLCEEAEDVSVRAQCWGLCRWWPTDRVSAIQISGITMWAL